MSHRIISALIASILAAACSLPFAAFFTMGGHSLIILPSMSWPLGLLAGLAISDIKRSFRPSTIVVRSLISAAILGMVMLIAFAGVVESSFERSAGDWLLLFLPLVGILLTAILSEPMLKRSGCTKSNDTTA